MKINKNSETNRKIDRGLKSGVVLGATLLASNFAGVVSAHAVEAPKTTTPVSPLIDTVDSVSKTSTGTAVNHQIPKEVLDKYVVKSSNLSICPGDSIETKDISFHLYNEKGEPVNRSLYTWEKVKDEFPPDPSMGGITTTIKITLKTGESFERNIPVTCVYNSDLKTGKVVTNENVTLNVKVGDNVNEQYKENSINTIIRRGVYDNHEGKLLVETLTDVNTSPVNCKATLFTKDGMAHNSNCKVNISVIPADEFHTIMYDKNGEGLFVVSSSSSTTTTSTTTSTKTDGKTSTTTSTKTDSKTSTNITTDGKTNTTTNTTEVNKNNHFPIISGNDLYLNIGDTFNPGAINVSAHDDEDGDLTKFVKMSGENKVDISKEGIYEIKTWVDDKNGTETVRYFKVHVSNPKPKEDVKPVVDEKVSEKEQVAYPSLSIYNFSIKQGDKISNKEAIALSDAKATDKYDGDITDKIVFDSLTDVKTSVPGTYKVTAYIVNSKGMKTKSNVTITVNRENTASLIINVIDNGTGEVIDTSTSYKVKVGSTFTDDMIPNDIMKDYSLVKARINGIENKTISGVILPNENVITLYVNKDNKSTAPVEKPTEKPKDNVTDSSDKKEEIKKDKETKPSDKEDKYTKDDKVNVDNIVKNTPPTVIGKNIKLKKGDTFKLPMLELKALDIEDGDITDNIETIASDVDTSKVGNYKVKVSIKDKNGEEVTKEFHVDVEDTQPEVKSVKSIKNQKDKVDNQKVKSKEAIDKSEPVKQADNSKETKLYKTGIDAKQSKTFAWLSAVLSLLCMAFGLSSLTKNKKGLED